MHLQGQSVWGYSLEFGFRLSEPEEERAQTLHRKAIFVNGCDSTSIEHINDEYFDGLLKTGVTSAVFTLYFPMELDDPLVRVLGATARWFGILENSNRILLARTAEDIERAKKEGKIAAVFGSQDGSFILDPTFVKLFGLLGFRVIQLTYQKRNLIGDGCGERDPSGLSKFGLRVVEEMNRAGVVIDLAHVSKRTTLDAIEVSKDPVMCSHSSVHSIVDVVRNRTDEEIKALAEKGGVIGLVPKSNWIRPNGLSTGTTVADYVDHIDYVTRLVGVDHAGIGLDIGDGTVPHGHYTQAFMRAWAEKYPEIGGPTAKHPEWTPGLPLENIHPKGIQPPYPEVMNITRSLVARGYSDQDIIKIIGGNFLRVFREVWK